MASRRVCQPLNPALSTTLSTTTMDTPALLPCPFCGATDDDNSLRRVIDGEWENCWIECDKCGAQGPHVAMQQLPIDDISDEDFIKAKNLADAEASAAAATAWNQRSAWQHPREGTGMADNEFNALCDAHGFSAVARGDFPLVPRDMFKAFADAAVLAERERSAWQPIETAPRDGTWVRLAGGKCDFSEESDNKGREVTGQWTTDLYHKPGGNWQFAYYDEGFHGEYKNPTHWQPLPSSPPITP